MIITDPGIERRHAWLEPLGMRFINDARDLPFLLLGFKLTLMILPLAAMFYVVPADQFPWWAAAAYWALLLFYAGPYNLMLHNTSHRRFFHMDRVWLNRYIGWFLGLFFGHAPHSYYIHHVGMHHPENNLENDLSSTMAYQRDSVLSFLKYYWMHIGRVYYALPVYMHKKQRTAMRNGVLVSIIGYYVVLWVLAYFNWRATLVVFIVPYFGMHFLMMAGNWGQHAFIDKDAPENCYRNSITCINGLYNRRCFNDGYHIGHHIKPSRHWTEMPGDFLANRETYAAEKAIVFEGIDFFGVWAFLMLKRYDWLANRFVDLEKEKRSKDEIIALLRQRTRAISSRAAAPYPTTGSLRQSPSV